MEIQPILKDLDKSTKSFVNAVSEFPEKHFNTKLSEKSWSAAEITEHVIIVERLLSFILKGKIQKTKENQYDEKVKSIKKAFLDFNKKYSAHGPILPKPDIKNKIELLKQFDKNRKNIKVIINTEDLTPTCLDFKHGLFGELTRYEWIYFIKFHSERHDQQIRNININSLK